MHMHVGNYTVATLTAYGPKFRLRLAGDMDNAGIQGAWIDIVIEDEFEDPLIRSFVFSEKKCAALTTAVKCAAAKLSHATSPYLWITFKPARAPEQPAKKLVQP